MLIHFFFILAVMCPARAERPTPPHPGNYQISDEVEYYKTLSNYDGGGNSYSLLGGPGELDNTSDTLRASFDWSTLLRTYAHLTYSHTDSTDGTIGRSNGGLSDGGIGAQAWIPLGPLALVPQVDFRYPFFRVSEASNSALIGEGAMQAQGGTWLILRQQPVQPFVYAGYDYRDAGRSALLPYAAGVNFHIPGWWIEGAWRGFMSVSNDSDTGDTLPRELFVDTVDGGSFHFYAVNPRVNEVTLSSGVRFGAWGAFASFATSVNGANYSNGWSASLGVSFNGKVASVAEAAPAPANSEEHFQLEKDKYDESLFIENPKPDEQNKVKRKVRQQPSVDKLLHDTEKELNQSD